MPETPPHTAGTRAELLQQQRSELAGLARRRWSVTRLGLPVLLSVVLVAVALPALDAPDDESSTARTLALLVILLAWAAAQWRHVRTSRTLEARRATWLEADRTPAARSLHDGGLDPEIATIWDVRDDPRLEEVASNVGFARQQQIFAASPVVSMVLGGITGILWTIAAVVVDPASGRDQAVAAVAFAAVALSGWTLTWTSGREYWRRQLAWNQVGLERQVYLERRRVLHGTETAPDPRLPAWARPVAAAALGAVLLLVVVRVSSANTGVLLAAALVLLAAGALVAVAVVRAQRLHVVPLRAGGTDVLSSPPRRVRVEIGDDAFTITDVAGEATPVTVRFDRVRHACSLPATYAWVPAPLVVVTNDEPIVLAGRGTEPLRQRLT